MKTDPPSRRVGRWLKKRQQLSVDVAQRCILLKQRAIDLRETLEDRRICGNAFAQPDEGSDYIDTHLYCALAAKYVGCHQDAVLGKYERPESTVAVLLGTGHKL